MALRLCYEVHLRRLLRRILSTACLTCSYIIHAAFRFHLLTRGIIESLTLNKRRLGLQYRESWLIDGVFYEGLLMKECVLDLNTFEALIRPRQMYFELQVECCSI